MMTADQPLSSSSSLLSSNRGRFVEVDDGHIPETWKNNAENRDDECETTRTATSQSTTNLLCYYNNNNNMDGKGDGQARNDNAFVQVRDDRISEELVSELYKATLERSPAPWGTYVTLDEAKAFNQDDEGNDSRNAVCHRSSNLQILSTRLVAEILKLVAQKQPPPDYYHEDNNDRNNDDNSTPFNTTTTTSIQALLTSNHVHGVALWGLASQDDDQVRYHLDYAELLRYEHNIIVPPILAGTLQCTPRKAAIVHGGAFCVNLDGLEHYLHYGYKAAKVTHQEAGTTSDDDDAGYDDYDNSNNFAGWKPPPQQKGQEQDTQFCYTTSASPSIHYNPSTRWMTIPYRFNRLIFHSGHLPHLSTPIQRIETISSVGKQRRVIVGLNFFCDDYGPRIQPAPEHSDAFLARVKYLREERKTSRLSIQHVLNNKSLSKLLVLAKREKVKQELLREQQELDQEIQKLLSWNQDYHSDDDGTYNDEPTSLTVKDVVQRLVAKNGANDEDKRQHDYRTEASVLVHLHHRVGSTTATTTATSSRPKNGASSSPCRTSNWLGMYCPVCDSHVSPCSCTTEDGLIPAHAILRLRT